MKYRISLLVIVVGFICGSCQTTDDSREAHITGTYVREYSYKIIHPNTGQEIGMRTIRDSIFIEETGNEYEISNSKWRKNDYDDIGWQNMEHAEDRPVPPFTSKFHSSTESLASNTGWELYFDESRSTTYWRKGVDYHKVKE